MTMTASERRIVAAILADIRPLLVAEVRALRPAPADRSVEPDPADTALLAALADVATRQAEAEFTASAMWARRHVYPDLGAAFKAADIESTESLGYALRRLAAYPPGGDLVVQRGDKSADGRLWSIRLRR